MKRHSLFSKRMLAWRWPLAVFALCSCAWRQSAQTQGRVIEILAGHDSRFKIEGQKQPEIKLKVGEKITLRIAAQKAKTTNRDGAVHGIALLHAKDKMPVPGWDFELKPGVQEFNVTAPNEPGEYIAVCTVVCSEEHEGMHMKVTVLP